MCGIAGYSLRPGSSLERTLAAQALLAAIAERGADAVGYAYRAPGRDVPDGRQAADACVGAARARRGAADARTSCSCTSATTRRAIRRSTPTTIPSGTGRSSASTTGSSSNDDELLAAHSCARAEPQHDRRLRGDLRGRRPLAERRARARAPARRDGRRLARRARAGRALPRPAASGGRSGSARAATSVFFASTEYALEVVERYCGLRLRKREVRRGDAARRHRGQRRPPRALPAGSRLRRGRPAAGGAGAAGARLLPAPPRRARGDLAVADEPSGPTSAPSSSSRSRIRNWNVAQAPRRDSNMR